MSFHWQRECPRRSWMIETTSEHSTSLADRGTASTGTLRNSAPSGSAISAGADTNGARRYGSSVSLASAKLSGFLEITANAHFRIGVVERRFRSNATSFVLGNLRWKSSKAALEAPRNW